MPTDLEISFVEVQEKNVEQLKVLNRGIFPINYQVNVTGYLCVVYSRKEAWQRCQHIQKSALLRFHRTASIKTY